MTFHRILISSIQVIVKALLYVILNLTRFNSYHCICADPWRRPLQDFIAASETDIITISNTYKDWTGLAATISQKYLKIQKREFGNDIYVE